MSICIFHGLFQFPADVTQHWFYVVEASNMPNSNEHDKVSNDGVMMGQRRRRLTNITPCSCLVLRGYCNVVSILTRCLRRRPKVITTLGENAVFSVSLLFTCSLTCSIKWEGIKCQIHIWFLSFTLTYPRSTVKRSTDMKRMFNITFL